MSESDVLLDAYGAMAYLATLREVDSNRIVLLGWSLGGGIALESSRTALEGTYWPRDLNPRFRAIVSFYPPCDDAARAGGDFYAPVLVLVGEEDDWVSPDVCTDLSSRRAAGGSPHVVVLPGATHGYDIPGAYYRSLSRRIIYNQAATTQSKEIVRKFLVENVGK